MMDRSVMDAHRHADAGRDEGAEALPPTAFYCVSSATYFLGAVALINSLRLLGHAEPIFALDYGLSPAQRELLAQEATIVPSPDETTPFLLKAVAPLHHPADVMVLIDADIIVTRPMTELIERAREGRVLAVEHGRDRFFPEWGRLLGRTASYRRYVSSSLVLLGGEANREVIRLMHELQGRIEIERSPYSGPRADFSSMGDDFWQTASAHPFFFADQDLLNAILATAVEQERVEVLNRRLEAILPFAGLRVVDEQTLRCAYDDGTEPYAVHHFLPAKPWLERTTPGIYTQLLVRLLRGGDVAIRVAEHELPPHLSSGLSARARRTLANLGGRLRHGRSGRLYARIRALGSGEAAR
jgi:hypothetical protein